MRGTRIASSISDQRATSWGQPIPGLGTVIRPHFQLAMTVGSSASLRGFRPSDHSVSQFGALEPDKWANERIWEFTVHATTDLVTITFSTEVGLQLANVSTLLVTISGFKDIALAPFEATFGTTDYTATVAGLGAYMDANVGNVIAIKLGRRA